MDKPDLLDKAISMVIMLFILSMIAERFVTWMKLYFGKPGRSLPGFSDKTDNMRREPRTVAEEKRIEVKVTGLNIVLSILIALAANANLFSIMNAPVPFNGIGWQGIHFEFSGQGIGRFLLLLLGCTLTGLFISLGSKFWHDLLDLLLYTKNLKQKLSDPRSYAVTSADQLSEFVQFSDASLVDLAIKQHGEILRTRFPNIQFFNNSIRVVDNQRRSVMAIFISDNASSGLPSEVPVTLPSGATYKVITEIIPEVGVPMASGGMDGAVKNATYAGYAGSGCCLVANANQDKNYLLTNCHVLTRGYVKSPLTETRSQKVLYGTDEIGKWEFGVMGAGGDFGLVLLNNVAKFRKDSDVETFNSSPRKIKKEDWLEVKVSVRGNKCNTIDDCWVIEVITDKVDLYYKNNEKISFSSMILVADRPDKVGCRSVSKMGDSGGAVYDDQMNLIGIITGLSEKYTYVLPVAGFLTEHNLKII